MNCLYCGRKVEARTHGDWECLMTGIVPRKNDGCGAWMNYGTMVGYRKRSFTKPRVLPKGTLLILKDTEK